MIVCSGVSQRCALMRSATCWPVSTLGSCTSTAPTPSCRFPSSPSIVRRHVVLDEEAVAFDGCDDVGLVAAGVEVAMADLAVVIGADGVVALADVDQDVHIVRQALDRDVDGRPPRRGLPGRRRP